MKNKKLISFVLAAVLILGLCTGCGKKDDKDKEIIPEEAYNHKEYELKNVAVSKDETAYVNLNADGSISKINVSDHLHVAEPQVRIRDASDLENISDIKTFIEPVWKDGQLFWDMESTDLYYNGTTDKEPPVSIEIKYYLDGKEISPKKLEGKSGKVDIEITVTNKLKKANSGTGYDIYCPMIMAGGMIIPETGFTNVSVTNGTIIGDGSHEVILMLGIPGMDESIGASSLGIPFVSHELCDTHYTITADVSDFSIGNIMFAAIPFSSVTALSNRDMTEDISGINQVLSDLESIMTAMASQSVESVIDMLYGDVTQTESLINAISSASDIYEMNKPLVDLLIKLMSDENINAISKLASDMDALGITGMGKSVSSSLTELNSAVSGMTGNLGNFSSFANDLKTAIPILKDLEEALNTAEMMRISSQLPDSLEQIRQLRKTLEDSEEILSNLSVVANSDFMNQMQIILDTATKYTSGSMSQAQAQHLAGRMREWLSFGQTYDIFSAKPDGAKSTVLFVYKTAAIG